MLIFRRPLRVEEPVDASDGFGCLDEQPGLAQSGAEVGSGIVGGGWLACFGYDPKTTTLAFYDSLLRWQRDSGWSFESLGLSGREPENSAALQHWTAMLKAAPAAPIRPPQVGPFGVATDAESARDGYLAAVEDGDRPDRPRPLLPAEPLYPTARWWLPAAHQSCSGTCANSCSPRSVV